MAPIVTCNGDHDLFKKLQSFIVKGLTREPVEWKRSYGRPTRLINVDNHFVPFNASIIPGADEWTLVGRPFFHTFWTDCDIDVYKSSVKEDIADWLSTLREKEISDWLIVVVVSEDNRVKSKILRNSVYDRVKNDFCGRCPDRCVVLCEPLRNDARSSESWSIVLTRIRQLVLESYTQSLDVFEDHMRAERERRTDPTWSFCQYFLLQEELAFMYEMLALYEDALVQYDELDALFTQFILNHAAGENAPWLDTFSKHPATKWDGLCLLPAVNAQKRKLIVCGKASLLDLRNYLFSRQCQLLLELDRPAEICHRSIPFMHNCIKELNILQIDLPPGAVDCWVFLCCLELLGMCERLSTELNASGKPLFEAYSIHVAHLWEYSSIKLRAIAEVCLVHVGDKNLTSSTDQRTGLSSVINIIPAFLQANVITLLRLWCYESVFEARVLSEQYKSKLEMLNIGNLCWLLPGSDQVTVVGNLLPGITDDTGDSETISKLKLALSSKQAFCKHYLELCELAMVTYKHIGRIRTARSIGRNIASFYLEIGEPEKAEGFLLDVIKMYKTEGWEMLADEVRLDLAKCQESLQQTYKFCRTCMHLAASRCLSVDVKKHYQQKLLELASNSAGNPLSSHCRPVLTVNEVTPAMESFHTGDEVVINVNVLSHLVEPLLVNVMSLSLKVKELNQLQRQSSQLSQTHHSRQSSGSSIFSLNLYSRLHESIRTASLPLDLVEFNDWKGDGETLSTCGVVCHSSVLPQVDHGLPTINERRAKLRTDSDLVMSQTQCLLTPGENVLRFTKKIEDACVYSFSQLLLQVYGLELINSFTDTDGQWFSVLNSIPTFEISPQSNQLIAGIPQQVDICIKALHSSVNLLHVTSTPGLTVLSERNVVLPAADNNEDKHIIVTVIADYTNLNVEPSSHGLILATSAMPSAVHCCLQFLRPFTVTHSVHTSGTRKFIQITVRSSPGVDLELSDVTLLTDSNDAQMLSLNGSLANTVTVTEHQCMSFLWEMSNININCEQLQLTFQANYKYSDAVYQCHYGFKLDHFQTQYSVCCSIEAGVELSVGQCYQLFLKVKSEPSTQRKELSYEVLPDSSLWRLDGKYSGCVTFSNGSFECSLSVVPLRKGFLHLPQVKLFQISADTSQFTLEQNSESNDTRQRRSVDSLLVYNSSLKQQVIVIETPVVC